MARIHLGPTAVLSIGLLAAAPPARPHTATRAKPLDIVQADRDAPTESSVQVDVFGEWRVIEANAIPAHAVGRFPNRGNPHSIEEQDLRFRVPAHPKKAPSITRLDLGLFGVAINGVPFDPGAAEWYRGDRSSPWRYEALGGAVPLGIDENSAHVQPNGRYHYHGLPSGLLGEVDDGTAHGALVGWAGDGFPIYALRGYADPTDPSSGVASVQSGWVLKQRSRPGGPDAPGGTYDGAFVADYEFAGGSDTLDECNGRFGVTPEFPDGTYAYFLTADFPVIPRCFVGTPSSDFQHRPPPPGPPGHRGKRPPPRPPR